MKPVRFKTPPCEILVERGILKKAGSLLASPGGGARRFLWTCDLPDTDPAPAVLLAALQKAGHTVVRATNDSPTADAILAVGDTEALEQALLYASRTLPDLPCALVPTTFRAQLDFPLDGPVGLVLSDPSLPVSETDFRRGVVELIRYAVGFDRLLFDLLYTDFDRGALIRRCLSVRRDLLDAGKTDLFDRLGAPIGLAVSGALAARNDDLDDSDAEAIGLAAATRYALKIGYCRRDFLSELVGLLTYRGLPNSALISDEELLASFSDRPSADGKIVLSLPRRLGECGLITVKPTDLTGLLPV